MAPKTKIIGRKDELKILETILKSPKAEFLAVYGRRRIGKTFLLYNFFEHNNCVFFYVSGMKNHTLAEQMEEFTKQISKTFYNGAPLATFKRWIDVFEALTNAINNVPENKKVVMFFDEFPWMATKKSKLLPALDYYWNRFWGHNSRLKLVLCGSASSWIIKNVINNKEGLYNRVTRAIELKSFTLAETKHFLKSQRITLNDSQILNLYMVLGGVPFYLEMIEKNLSAEQCIDKLCFRANGSLFEEFNRLFSSLFDKTDIYIKMIKLLAQYRYGMGQADILKQCDVPESGRAAQRLRELEQAGFITSFIPYKNQEKGIYYKVTDEFILFFLRWVEPNRTTIKREDKLKNYWHTQTATPVWASWAGYAFEAVCHKHVSNIRKALEIEVGCDVGTWKYISKAGDKDRGAQIDLLFDRRGDSTTICEIKYSKDPFAIDKQYAADLLNKIEVYKKQTGTRKQIFIAMVSANGLKPTMYSEEIVSGVVTLDDLFKE